MTAEQPAAELPLPYLIDALAQLREAIARRARELDDAEPEGQRWPRERDDWYRGIAPLQRVVEQQLERALRGLAAEARERPLDGGQLLNALVAAARLRLGGALDVDVLHGR